jgi:alkylhydroperoxidase family enzyme
MQTRRGNAMANAKTGVKFTRRNEIEEARAPEVQHAFRALQDAIAQTATIARELRGMIFVVSSLSSGCRHCQSHGAYGLARSGVPVEKIRALLEYETSPLFSEAERAALRFASAAGQAPNAVTPEHHADLRRHFTDAEIAQILVQLCVGGWLNRWNDSLATVTDEESRDWAMANLASVGWDIGKHVGDPSEQRKGTPEQMRRAEDEAWARRQAAKGS